MSQKNITMQYDSSLFTYISKTKSYKIHTRIETEEEFNETMDKIPEYGIEDEDVSRMTNDSSIFLLHINFRRRRPSSRSP